MTHAFTKMKRKHEVAIYENKRTRGEHKGKGYTIATTRLRDRSSTAQNSFFHSIVVL